MYIWSGWVGEWVGLVCQCVYMCVQRGLVWLGGSVCVCVRVWQGSVCVCVCVHVQGAWHGYLGMCV